jgi:uncharacterized protein with von Willebrand factor type A (vWA) domain
LKSHLLLVISNFHRKHREIHLLDSHETKEKDQAKISDFITKKGKYANSDPHQVQLTDALLKFIAGDLLPLSIVDSDEFRNLMEFADSKYQMSSKKHLSSKLLHEKSNAIRNNIIHQLKLADSVSLTIDIC